MFVRCAIRNCGYCSENNFCLNRVVAINEQGVCNYLTKPGWNEPVEDRFKDNYTREPVQSQIEPEPATNSYERYELLGVCDW